MRWVILTDDAAPALGGVATWVAAVVDGLRTSGDDVRVFARSRAGLEPGVTGVWGPSFGRRGGQWAGLRSWPARRWADRVVCTTWPMVPPALTADVVAHGADVVGPAGPRRARVLARCPVWAVSAALAGRARVAGASRVEVLPAPIDAAPSPAAGGTGRWLWVGRMAPGKGGDRFIQLVAAAGVAGTMVGDGPLRPAWASLAAAMGARVQFLGAVPRARLASVYRAHDAIVLLPRAYEGLGLCLLEGAAHGLVPIGCRVGGVAEAVGPHGVLVDPDDPAGAAEVARASVSPARGAAAWAWVASRHGRARTAQRLRDGQPP